MDGLAYLAFSQRTRTAKADENCTPGQNAEENMISLTQDEELILWQIRPDGTHHANALEAIHRKQPLSQPLTTTVPLSSLLTDNMNGTLIPVQSLYQSASGKDNAQISTFTYRANPDGQVLYKFKMPQYTGTLHDGIVITDNNLGFATRGDTLIAFNVETGDDLWHWKSDTDGIEVKAALANGHCLVQTPTTLVEVSDSATSSVLAVGTFMLDWRGQLLKVHR
jgi:outer membrane protein assembly factor BamB